MKKLAIVALSMALLSSVAIAKKKKNKKKKSRKAKEVVVAPTPAPVQLFNLRCDVIDIDTYMFNGKDYETGVYLDDIQADGQLADAALGKREFIVDSEKLLTERGEFEYEVLAAQANGLNYTFYKTVEVENYDELTGVTTTSVQKTNEAVYTIETGLSELTTEESFEAVLKDAKSDKTMEVLCWYKNQ